MKRRNFIHALSGLPFMGMLAASTVETIIYVHDLTLTRQKVAVFDLDGKTYGLKMTEEYIEAVRECHGTDPIELLREFVSTCTEWTVTRGATRIESRIGRIPEYEEASCLFVKEYKTPDVPEYRVSFRAGDHGLFWRL